MGSGAHEMKSDTGVNFLFPTLVPTSLFHFCKPIPANQGGGGENKSKKKQMFF